MPRTNSRIGEADRAVAARIRMRRKELGLTQLQFAELIGVTYQQGHKYEKGQNRVAAGRLLAIANALGVSVDYFYADLTGGKPFRPTPEQKLMLELAANFVLIKGRRKQEAVCTMVRALALDGDAALSTADLGRVLLGTSQPQDDAPPEEGISHHQV